MNSTPSFVAIDWGTSSFRLWHMTSSGEIMASHTSSWGMGSLTPDAYGPLLEQLLSELSVDESVPIIICGMAGAAQGWVEAPYIDTPTSLEMIPSKAVRVPMTKHDVRILPGLAQRDCDCPDVMRGEETLLLAVLPQLNKNATVCMPGTHSKWVTVEDGKVSGFSTYMTGEVFALMSKHSILSHRINNAGADLFECEAFAEGVKISLSRSAGLLNKMFSCRSGALLLDNIDPLQNAAKLSGLLIGCEVSNAHETVDGKVFLISDGELALSYARAFDVAGLSYKQICSAELARKGLHAAAGLIWPKELSA